jgi:flagellar biosynthetic protein FliR
MPTLTGMTANINSIPQLIVECLGELFVGLALGEIVTIIIYVVQLSGELIDMQMGLTMAQMYDSHSGTNMPLLGGLFNIIIILSFFSSNAHLYLISFVNDSFHLIAPGTVFPTAQSMHYIVALMSDYFEFGFRMALPVVAVEVMCQISIGMLMRAVPSINVFSIGMHLIIVFVTSSAIVAMCGQLVSFMMDKAAEFIRLLPSH